MGIVVHMPAGLDLTLLPLVVVVRTGEVAHVEVGVATGVSQVSYG